MPTKQKTKRRRVYETSLVHFIAFYVRINQSPSTFLRIIFMRELAEQVASILRAELTFDKPPTSGDRELYEEPPSRGDFTRIGRVPAAKARFAPELCDDIEEMKHLFCMVSGEFVLTSGVDVDHAIAYSQIRRRQLAFLALLNEQAEFAETFLTQPDMDNYFGRNESGVIQGRGYFYKACYNDLDNLWLLCHACNVEKSDQEALTWFAKQEPYFGEAFVKCVEEAGGLHAGLLIDRVYYDTGTDTKFLIGEKEVTLHEGESQGLGQFVRNWFFEHFKEHYEIHKEFYTKNFALLKEQLLEIQALAEGGAAPEVIQARFNHLHRRLEQLIVVQEALKKYAEETSSSGRHKDSSVSEEAKEALSGNTIRLEETRSLYT